MAYLLGTRRGLDACASPDGAFVVLALDHRQNLRRELRPSDPDSVSHADMTAFKAAVIQILAPIATGTLIDPEVGLGPAIAEGALPGGAGLIVAVEATGYLGLPGARVSRVLEGWGPDRVKRVGASAAKVLVYYHPDAPNAAAQEAFVARVADECRALDLALFVEPLSFGSDGGALTGEERRQVVVETARRLTPLGGDVLKAEFPYDASVTDRRAWADACKELDAATALPWVLLSGGVDDATFEAQAETACAAGASGVLVGRSVWAPAATLSPAERDVWLRQEGATRLRNLAERVGRLARPWRPRWERALHPDLPSEGWYARY
ncbi:MAG TPA: tagatose 1,6-diphosphate aldolase [Candidatus Limnocylindrales bacterium]|nr:tagatose 1,6-diphosphate aldolase [Candidatus Limnocylindrales bacterium]